MHRFGSDVGAWQALEGTVAQTPVRRTDTTNEMSSYLGGALLGQTMDA